MTDIVRHGRRQFQIMCYHEHVQGDAPAIELAELVDGELMPAAVTVVFLAGGGSTEARVLLAEGDLPLPILTSFMTAVGEEQRRIRDASNRHGRR